MNLLIFDLTDKVAIVTGSSRGIGKAIALGLAGAGAHVVVAARTTADVETSAAEIRALSRKALALPTDVRDSEQVAKMVEKTMEEFGRIDILVNNAGGVFPVSPLEMSEGAWDAIIRENLKSVFLCSKAVGKIMVEQKKGSIINISSMAALRGYVMNVSYGAAKAGIISLTMGLAVELAPHQVRVNAIVPGAIDTPGVMQQPDYPKIRQERLEMIPMGRLGKPEDIAGAAIYLASDASSYTTGASILIDGGLINWVVT